MSDYGLFVLSRLRVIDGPREPGRSERFPGESIVISRDFPISDFPLSLWSGNIQDIIFRGLVLSFVYVLLFARKYSHFGISLSDIYVFIAVVFRRPSPPALNFGLTSRLVPP